MSGARARVLIVDPNTDQGRVVGLFTDVSYGLTFDAQPAYILGRYSPAEIDYTAQEPVQVTCSGWRVVGHGAHKDAAVPNLKDLLTHNYIDLAIEDRQTGRRIAIIRNVRPTGYSTSISARQLETITVTFVGILLDDEDTTNTEADPITDLPQT